MLCVAVSLPGALWLLATLLHRYFTASSALQVLVPCMCGLPPLMPPSVGGVRSSCGPPTWCPRALA